MCLDSPPPRQGGFDILLLHPKRRDWTHSLLMDIFECNFVSNLAVGTDLSLLSRKNLDPYSSIVGKCVSQGYAESCDDCLMLVALVESSFLYVYFKIPFCPPFLSHGGGGGGGCGGRCVGDDKDIN
jgi:hypothetical protein